MMWQFDSKMVIDELAKKQTEFYFIIVLAVIL